MSEQHDGEKPAGVRVTITVLQFLVGMVAGVLLTVGSCAGAYTGRYSTAAKQQWWEDHVWTVMPVAAVLGGLIIGILENLSGGYLDHFFGGGVKEVAPFVALVIILMIKPYGLFGTEEIERV